MEQRPLRLGDILDDYCPRERRLTNHAIVAMIEDEIRQTRCTTCDAEHVYKGGKVPKRRKKETPAALYKEVLAGMPDTEAAPILASAGHGAADGGAADGAAADGSASASCRRRDAAADRRGTRRVRDRRGRPVRGPVPEDAIPRSAVRRADGCRCRCPARRPGAAASCGDRRRGNARGRASPGGS